MFFCHFKKPFHPQVMLHFAPSPCLEFSVQFQFLSKLPILGISSDENSKIILSCKVLRQFRESFVVVGNDTVNFGKKIALGNENF